MDSIFSRLRRTLIYIKKQSDAQNIFEGYILSHSYPPIYIPETIRDGLRYSGFNPYNLGIRDVENEGISRTANTNRSDPILPNGSSCSKAPTGLSVIAAVIHGTYGCRRTCFGGGGDRRGRSGSGQGEPPGTMGSKV